MKSQNNVCAICGNPEIVTYKGKIRSLAIDHDHKTGNVRGLLCFSCNTKLPIVEDTLMLEKFQSYLKEHSV